MRKWTFALASMLLLILLAAACGTPPAEEPAPEEPAPAAGAAEAPPVEVVDEARRAASALGSTLMSTLVAELEKSGPAGAIEVCGNVAGEIAEAQSDDRKTVRRVTLRLRNAANAPDDYERAKLEELAGLHRRGELPREMAEVVQEDGVRTVRYMAPIVVLDPCLRCHGTAETLDPEVRGMLAERYPDDQATGYAAGDLRGAISVAVKLD